MSDISLPQIAELLSLKDNILIITHIRPDGDTLGSALGLKSLLRGKTAYVICADDIPRYLRRIFNIESLSADNLPEDFNPEFVISVDTASLELAGEYGKLWEGKIDLKIDHHGDGDTFAAHNYIDASAAACAEIIYDLAGEMGTLDAVSAAFLYTAIVTDTGCFKYSNTTPKTLRSVACMLETGMDNMAIHEILFSSRTKKEISAISITYAALRYWRNDTIASIVFTNEMKSENDLTDEDIGDISALPRQIEGVELGITIKQHSDEHDKFKISMRSGKSIEANKLCALFGGGGHAKAAGAMISSASAEEAEKTVIEAVLSALNEGIGLADESK